MELPASIGKYELLEFLGGGMSHVYRARDTVIDRAVVVKILTDQATSDPEAKARFLQEAKLAGGIQHENIVSVFDYGEHDGHPYIVMEYLKGEDLREAIRGGRLGSMAERLKIALDIAQALDYVHGRAIVHRDIKPENIHIDPNGRVKLMDFGIAKTADLSLTRTGMAMGTPYYMSPEQIAGRAATNLVDIYAYGQLVFELLTGVRGVRGETMEQVFYQILNVPVDVEAMENAGAPPKVRDLVLCCTAKKPEDRPQSFKAIIEELRGIMAGEPGSNTKAIPTPQPFPAPVVSAPAPPVQAPAKGGGAQKALWAVAAALAVLAVGIAIWVWRKPSGPPGQTSSGQTGATTAAKAAIPQIPGMVYIAEGTFLAGPAKTPTPLHAFYIDETEVSNAEYCRVMGCTPAGPDDMPVVNITVAKAREYAEKVEKRLPTALEWERAVRGTDGNLFPWGNDADPAKANVRNNPSSSNGLMPVRSFAGPLYNLIGNVWEMTGDSIVPSSDARKRFPSATPNEPWYTTRGGSFKLPLNSAFAYDAVSTPESYSSDDLGFRCVKDP
jgi:eukaryotic-like serine/threonine-protein kinase